MGYVLGFGAFLELRGLGVVIEHFGYDILTCFDGSLVFPVVWWVVGVLLGGWLRCGRVFG